MQKKVHKKAIVKYIHSHDAIAAHMEIDLEARAIRKVYYQGAFEASRFCALLAPRDDSAICVFRASRSCNIIQNAYAEYMMLGGRFRGGCRKNSLTTKDANVCI